MIAPNGEEVSLGYDSGFRLTTITDALGQVTTISHDDPADGYRITKVSDPFGREAQFTYDPSGRLSKITDVIGIESQFTYQGSGTFINALTTPYGTTQFAYGENGVDRWLEVTDPEGNKERTEFRGTTSSVGYGLSDPIGTVPPDFQNYLTHRNTFFWDKKAMSDPSGPTDFYHRAKIYHWLHGINFSQASGTLESIKLPFESRICFRYQGQPIPYIAYSTMQASSPSRIIRKLDTGSAPDSTQDFQYVYNSLGHPTKTIDPLGRETNITYATNNIDPISIKQKDGQTEHVLAQYAWNTAHQPLTSTGPDGGVTTYTYNARGQVLTITNPLGDTTTHTYNANGQLTSIDGPLPGAIDEVVMTYDAVGRPATITNPDGDITSLEYDALDRITKITFPDSTFEQYHYRYLDLEWFRDREARWTRYWHNSLRQRIAEVNPLSQTTLYRWCRCGALSTIIDPKGQLTRWRYDIASRPIRKEYPNGTAEDYAYDLAGRMIAITDAASQVKAMEYFRDNHLKNISYQNPVHPTPDVDFAYDPVFDRMTGFTDGTGTTTMTYFPANGQPGATQLASVTNPAVNATINYTYDLLGRLVGRDIGSSSVSMTYDALGRLLATTNPLGTLNYTYEDASERLLTASGSGHPLDAHYSYFGNAHARRLQSMEYSNAQGIPSVKRAGLIFTVTSPIIPLTYPTPCGSGELLLL